MLVSKVSGRSVRGGFTLVELLIVTLIIAILATITITAYTGSMELGKSARTRAQIAKINDLLAPIWESYSTRRVKIPPRQGGRQQRLGVAAIRTIELRRLMRWELPDRITDVLRDNIAGTSSEPDRPLKAKLYWEQVKFALNAQQARYQDDQARPEDLREYLPQGWTRTYQGAECLYLILSNIQEGDQNGLDFFRQTEIGDADNDGMPEILDGWGNPISFVRWPAGFVSDKQQPFDANGNVDRQWRIENPDPYDPLGTFAGFNPNEATSVPKTYLIYPLVFSAGPDGKERIWTGKNHMLPDDGDPNTTQSPMITYENITAISSGSNSQVDQYLAQYFVQYEDTDAYGGRPTHNPFWPFAMDQNGATPMPVGALMTQATDAGYLDNIHNHVVRTRIR